MKDITKLKELYGETVSLITPSGFSVVIRQQTGEDDDTISNAVDTQDGTSINKFIASMVVDSDFNDNGRLSLEDIMTMKLCDKYFLIIASRIFSLGETLRFNYTWPGIKEPVEYVEDLAQYIWAYGEKEFPFDPSHPDYFSSRIKPHPFKKELAREFTIFSGKKLRYTFMNGEGEKYLMKLPDLAQSKNQELLARKLEAFIEGKWTKIESFRFFSALEMVDVRKEITTNDPSIDLISELENPYTHEKIPYPVVGTMDFFFPRGV